jgi:hypothetical protein
MASWPPGQSVLTQATTSFRCRTPESVDLWVLTYSVKDSPPELCAGVQQVAQGA